MRKKRLSSGPQLFLPEAQSGIKKAAQDIPIVVSANFSLGITVCLEMAAALARSLPGYRVDIHETHHIHKKDRPSGTALALARALVSASDTMQRSILSEQMRLSESTASSFPAEMNRSLSRTRRILETPLPREPCFAAKKLIGKPAGIYALKDLFLHA